MFLRPFAPSLSFCGGDKRTVVTTAEDRSHLQTQTREQQGDLVQTSRLQPLRTRGFLASSHLQRAEKEFCFQACPSVPNGSYFLIAL